MVPASGLAHGMRVFQAQGVRGFQLAASQPHALGFPASRLFIHCDRFPEEFSIIVTLRVLSFLAKVSAAGWARSWHSPALQLAACRFESVPSRRETSTSSR